MTDLAAWRASAKIGKASADAHLRKVVKVSAVKEAGAEGERKLAWIISTGNPDRESDVIAADGWEWDNWVSAGAPILWSHNYYMAPYNVPIAQGSQPQLVEGNKLRSIADFGESGLYPFADMIYELARPRDGRPGRLRAASVGFRPIEWTYDEERNGINWIRQEGLEWSIVPIPANAEAVQESRSLAAAAKSLGVDVPLREFAEAVMDGFEPGGMWLPKAHALEILKAARAGATSVSVPAEPAKEATIPVQVTVDEAALQKLVAETEARLRDEMKAGRTFSKENEARLRDAHAGCASATTKLQECLDQIAAESEDDEQAAAPEPTVKDTPEAPASEGAEEAPALLLYPEVPATAKAAA